MKFPTTLFTTSKLPVTAVSLVATTALFILIHIPPEVIKLKPHVEDSESHFDLELCGCSRSVQIDSKEDDGIAFEDTSCGLDAFRRGSGQKVFVSLAMDSLWQTQSSGIVSLCQACKQKGLVR